MRLMLVPLALGLLAPANVYAASAGADPWADEAEPEAPAPTTAPAEEAPTKADSGKRAAKKGASAKASAKKRKARVHLVRRPGKPVGWVVPEANLRAEPLPPPSGNLHLYVLATHETVKVNILNEDGSYNVDSLKEVSHLLRCKRTDDVKDIDPRLVSVLSHVYDHYNQRIEIVSGYRNQRKQTSHHFSGTASDIRVPGVAPKKLRDFVDTLDTGGLGVGLYPRSRFVHIDVRPLPSFRWIDNSRSNPDSPDKRPPRGWKRKKRLS